MDEPSGTARHLAAAGSLMTVRQRSGRQLPSRCRTWRRCLPSIVSIEELFYCRTSLAECMPGIPGRNEALKISNAADDVVIGWEGLGRLTHVGLAAPIWVSWPEGKSRRAAEKLRLLLSSSSSLPLPLSLSSPLARSTFLVDSPPQSSLFLYSHLYTPGLPCPLQLLVCCPLPPPSSPNCRGINQLFYCVTFSVLSKTLRLLSRHGANSRHCGIQSRSPEPFPGSRSGRCNRRPQPLGCHSGANQQDRGLVGHRVGSREAVGGSSLGILLFCFFQRLCRSPQRHGSPFDRGIPEPPR